MSAYSTLYVTRRYAEFTILESISTLDSEMLDEVITSLVGHDADESDYNIKNFIYRVKHGPDKRLEDALDVIGRVSLYNYIITGEKHADFK